MKPVLMFQSNGPHYCISTALFHRHRSVMAITEFAEGCPLYETPNCYFQSIEVQVKEKQRQQTRKKEREKKLISASALSLNNNIMSQLRGRSLLLQHGTYELPLVSERLGKVRKEIKKTLKKRGEEAQAKIYLVG